MPTIVARELISRAGRILVDDTNVYWPENELLDWLNDGQLEIVGARPEANVVNESVQLVAGTKQMIPAAGIRFLGVVRNMGADGATPGRVVTPRDMSVMDQEMPTWHMASPSAEAKHYFHDPVDVKRFYVYPPQPTVGQGYVEIKYSSAPGRVLTPDSTITIDDVYAPALLNYMLYRAYSKDSKANSSAQGKSERYFKLYLASLYGGAVGDQAGAG